MTNRLSQIKARLERFNAMGWQVATGPDTGFQCDGEPCPAFIRAGMTEYDEALEAADLLAQIHNIDLPWLVEQAERIERFEADIAKNAEQRCEKCRRRYVRDEAND